MESAQSILQLEQSGRESELLDALTVPKLKLLCKEKLRRPQGTRPILSAV